MEAYDVMVIGAGSAGGHAALRAAHFGPSVACVERDLRLSRSSLITDGLPAKAQPHASALDDTSRVGENARFGLECRTTAAAERSRLFAEPRIAWCGGTARIAGLGKVTVRDCNDAWIALNGRHVVITTGLQPVPLPGSPFDHERILSGSRCLHAIALSFRCAQAQESQVADPALDIIGGDMGGTIAEMSWRVDGVGPAGPHA